MRGKFHTERDKKYLDHAEKKFVMIEFWWDKTRDNPLVTTT